MKILNTIAERIRQIINPVIEEINWFLICVIIFLGGGNMLQLCIFGNSFEWTDMDIG